MVTVHLVEFYGKVLGKRIPFFPHGCVMGKLVHFALSRERQTDDKICWRFFCFRCFFLPVKMVKLEDISSMSYRVYTVYV